MNVVIYARYSCSNQREESIEGQLKVCYDYARKNNYTVIKEYIDRAISGKTDQRPSFLNMIEDSKEKQFEKVIVYKLDRFSRDKYDSAIYKAKLNKNGVKVISACENIPDDETGILIETLLEGIAQYYSGDLSRKVKRGMNSNAEKCISTGGTIPLGFFIGEDRKYHIDEDKAHIVKMIFEMYSNGNTMKSIIDFLNEKHYKTVKGNEFNKNSIYKMLSNKKYIGYYVYNGTEIKDGVPRIIDDELFEKCQEILRKNKLAPARAKAKVDYLLTTKIFCAKCNSLMVGVSGKGRNGAKYCYYKCKERSKKLCDSKQISKDYIEDIVVSETKKIFTEENIEKIANEIMKLCQKNSNDDIVKHLEREKNKIDIEINNLLKIIEKGNISDLIIERISQKKNEKEDIEKKITIEKMKKPILTHEKIVEFLKLFKSGDINDLKYRKSLIDVFINRVIVDEKKLTILYNLQNNQSSVLYNTTVVSQKGFEPPTPGLEGLCSIQLSY